jgi:hypothetical protein
VGTRLFSWFLGFILLIVILCAASWYQTKKSLVNYCRETPVGTSLARAEERARQHGFRFINYSSADHKAFVTASGVMGRYVCVIEHDGKRVVKSSLDFND